MLPRSNRPATLRVATSLRALVAALATHRWFAAGALASLLLFGGVMTGGTGRLLVNEPLGDFYDYQAASLLRGRLDVPLEAIVFEAFVFQGKNYGYFGLTPALLRVPLVALGISFGEVSRIYMLGYFAAVLLASYLLLLHALARRGLDPRRPNPWLVLLLVGNAGVGNTLFFLGSRSYAYHEAILCGAAFTLWSAYCSLRHLSAPQGRWWIGALLGAWFAVHARPPIGLFALTLCGVTACALAYQQWHDMRGRGQPLAWIALRRPALLAGAATLALFSFNGLSYLKFRTLNGHPLEYNVDYTPERLARFGGRHFHLSNLPFGLDTFLLRPNVTASRHFPYLKMDAPPKSDFPQARLDWTEPTLAFPYAMPSLFLLATVGCALAWRTFSASRLPLAMLWISALPMAFVMMAGIAFAHRYTADFVPLFICSAGFALAAIAPAPSSWFRRLCASLTLLTALSVGINFLLTLRYQGEEVWGVSEETRARYVQLQQRIDTWFGCVDPHGYGAVPLSCRNVDASYYSWRIRALVQKKETVAKAMALYERELSRNQNPYAADTHFVMSDLYLANGQLPQALQALQTGVSANPAVVDRQVELAELYAKLGRDAEAIEHYEVALQLKPDFAVVHYNVGVSYAKLGKFDDALRHFEIALRLNPNFAEARANLEKLRRRAKQSP